MRSLTRVMEMLAGEPQNAVIDEWFNKAAGQYDDLLAGRYLHLSRNDYVDSAGNSAPPPSSSQAPPSPPPQSNLPPALRPPASGSRLSLAGQPVQLNQSDVDDLNTVFRFLSTPSYLLPAEGDVDGTVYVLAGNAILPLSWELFGHLEEESAWKSVTLVISGGIGHSTQYLYDAVARDEDHSDIASRIQGMAEADILLLLLRKSYGLTVGSSLELAIQKGLIKVLIDNKSTNCGANAIETKRLLDEQNIWPRRLCVVQDPTMHRRTLAGFEKIYSEDALAKESMPELRGWTVQPKVKLGANGEFAWERSDEPTQALPNGTRDDELWDPARFISLVLGEIPRLRDDKDGYGPNGAGYISHVDIPEEVEEAWSRLNQKFTS